MEAKAGAKARLSKRQAAGHPLVNLYGGTVIGKQGGARYPAGVAIRQGTKVEMIRPSDLGKGTE